MNMLEPTLNIRRAFQTEEQRLEQKRLQKNIIKKKVIVLYVIRKC
jgi:hypothetical protein